MGKFAKWIGMGLGFTFGGPIGALVGFLIGSYADSETEKLLQKQNRGSRSTKGDFALSLIVLIAAVMKADGKVLKSELNFVKSYFTRVFGQETSAEAIIMLREILNKDIPVEDVAAQIGRQVNYSSRLQLLQMLFGVIVSDGEAHESELNVAKKIAYYMGINNPDFDSIKAMYVKTNVSPYKILGIEPSATEKEIKTAYRKMAMKYHPDKLVNLGEEIRKEGELKFKKVNEAYEAIKKQRGLG